jgi:YaiO family outer membrane protein
VSAGVTPRPPRPLWVAAGLSVALAGPAAAAEPDGWALDLTGDRAGITLFGGHDTWWSGRAQVGFRREGKGGAFAAVEAYRRFGATDTTFVAAGWRHVDQWSFYAEAGVTPGADFYYRHSVEVEAYRRIRGPWVPHLGYRYWQFPGATLHLVSPRVTRYGARSEIHARLILVRNATTGRGSAAVFARGHWDVRPRLRVGAGFAAGERIFDVTSLPGDPAPGWVVFGEARVGVGPRDSVGLTLRRAAEGSEFDQTAIGLSYRRTF